MKLRFLVPFYAVLMTITYCNRKADSAGQDLQRSQKLAGTPAVAPAEIPAMSDQKVSGTLMLNEKTNTINADLWLKVSNPNYQFTGDHMCLTSDRGYKGLAFRYYDAKNNAPDNGKDTLQIHVQFSFKNDEKWQENDSIRVMSLDEDENVVFEGLKKYFMQRMDFFKEQPATDGALLAFNEQWNQKNLNNPVTTGTGTTKSKESGNRGKIRFRPRLTKDDGVLSLKVKR